MEDKICEFKSYVKQTLDLLIDAYKWKVMAEYCDNETMKSKYMTVSNTLFEMFMVEHNSISETFKKEV